MDTASLTILVRAIVSEQKLIIGPLAIEEANSVTGLRVSSDLKVVEVTKEGKQILTNLVHKYEELFGQASVEVCKDSIKEVLPKISSKDIPEFLK